MKTNVTKEFLEEVRDVLKSNLNAKTIVQTINTWAFPKIWCGVATVSLEEGWAETNGKGYMEVTYYVFF